MFPVTTDMCVWEHCDWSGGGDAPSSEKRKKSDVMQFMGGFCTDASISMNYEYTSANDSRAIT